MAGVTASPASGLYTNNGFRGSIGAQSINLAPFSSAIDRLIIHLQNNSTDDAEFKIICHCLSKFIDFSITNRLVPNRACELPSLLMKVCQIKTDILLQPAIMVLMISVKSACLNGWFPDQDSQELINLAKRIARNFCSVSDFIAELHPSHLVISTVISRFYPRLKMGHIFVSLEVKPGFDAYVTDFQIPKNQKCSPEDGIRLFVVQTDSLETSSCLVTPPKVNFLLNGKGVDRRTNFFMDTGPQVPIVVSPLLKYGPNLFQAVGEFNGNYMIIVAFMSEVPNPDSSTLQNCEQHAPETVDADSEVIEGSSRISLNCPISFKRIKTPVKGVSCNHIQCFDFDNYVDINSRRPSWRCPHCNQHVCFSDLRIVQKMVEILKEVGGPKVSDVIVSSDGSWNAVMESEDTTDKSEDKTLNESTQPADLLDLTQTDDPMEVNEIQDRKAMAQSQTLGIETNNVDQSSTINENDFWTGIFMSTFEMDARPNVQAAGPSPQMGTSALQYLQYQHGNSPDYARLSSVPSHITRTASAVQALPAQAYLQRGLPNAMGPFTTNGLSAASPTALNSTTNRPSPRQQNRSFSSAQPSHQNAGFRDPNQVPNMCRNSNELQRPIQQINLRAPPSTIQSPGVTQSSMQSLRPQGQAGVSQNRIVHRTGQQSYLIANANRAVNISVGATRTVPSYPRTHDGHNMPTPVGDQRGINGAMPSSQPADPNASADMNWRPSAPMRGALRGQAYADALNRYIIQPSQQAQAVRPASNTTPLPNNGLPDLPAFIPGGTVIGTPHPGFVSANHVVRPNILPNNTSE